MFDGNGNVFVGGVDHSDDFLLGSVLKDVSEIGFDGIELQSLG